MRLSRHPQRHVQLLSQSETSTPLTVNANPIVSIMSQFFFNLIFPRSHAFLFSPTLKIPIRWTLARRTTPIIVPAEIHAILEARARI